MSTSTRPIADAPLRWFAGALAVGWLLPLHVEPVASFYSEWLVGAALILASLFTLRAGARAGVTTDSVWRMPLSSVWMFPLLLVATLQLALGRLPNAETWFYGLLYTLAWFTTSVLAGANARTHGQEATMAPLAWALVIASGLSALIQVVQLIGWDNYLDPFIFPSNLAVPGRPYANIGQPNLVTTLHALAIGAAAWLWLVGRTTGTKSALLVLLSVLGMGIATSRTGLTYLFWFVVAAHLVRLDDPVKRSRIRLFAWIIVPGLLIAFFFLMPPTFAWLHGIELKVRLLNFNSSPRVILNHVSLAALDVKPWLGWGVGGYSEAFFSNLTSTTFIGLYPSHHAHNIFLELAVEFGWPAFVVFMLLALAHMITAIAKLQRSPTVVLVVCVLGILLTHSQFEFPLWYLHFFLAFAWCLACIDPQSITFKRPRQGVPMAQLALIICLALAGKIWIDFWDASNRLQRYFELDGEARAFDHPIGPLNAFASLHHYIDHAWTPLNLPLSAEELAWRRSATARRPFPLPLLKLIVAEQLRGHGEEARRLRRLFDQLYDLRADEARSYMQKACTELNVQAFCALAEPTKGLGQRSPEN